MYQEPYNGPERRRGDRRRTLVGPAAPFTALEIPERRQQGRRLSDRTQAMPREKLLDIARTFLLEEEAS